jgi:phosphopantothenoylcysteine synthetase/decarboxylase
MRILISSGGTIVPIDPVRSITNTSTGRFGSALATAALKAGMEVVYLTSTYGKSPFSTTIDFYQSTNWQDSLDNLKKLYQISDTYRARYREYRYQNFFEYAELLENIIQSEKPEIIMLAAAVSDYLVTNYANDKIRSAESLHLQLEPAPKIIHSVRKWSKHAFVIGFKLLVDAEDSKLAHAAQCIIKQHQLDLVIANNLSSIQRGAHEILLVEPDGSYQKISQNIAAVIIEEIVKRHA